MLGLDNPIHLLFILVLMLLVFGAKRLPEMGQSLGAGLRGFKESISSDSHVATMTETTPVPVTAPVAAPVPVAVPAESAQRPPMQPAA